MSAPLVDDDLDLARLDAIECGAYDISGIDLVALQEALMRIGELAVRVGVSVRALRYYEEQHLLVSERSPSGQRQYQDDAVDRVQLIQRHYGQAAGNLG